MSLDDLSNLSFLPSSHINALEEGRRNPHINSIFRICCALEVEPYMLLDTIYGEDYNGKRICLSSFSIEDNQLSKEEIRKIYDAMVASGKYISPDKE
jgi:transcriptional regulator with XRE-family HTH domain